MTIKEKSECGFLRPRPVGVTAALNQVKCIRSGCKQENVYSIQEFNVYIKELWRKETRKTNIFAR